MPQMLLRKIWPMVLVLCTGKSLLARAAYTGLECTEMMSGFNEVTHTNIDGPLNEDMRIVTPGPSY